MKSKRCGFILIAISLFISACSGGGGGNTSNTPNTNKISITPSPAFNMTAGGSAVQLSAKLTTASGAVIEGATFVWQSGDPSIVTVDSNGLAQGIKIGVTGITVSSGTGITATSASVKIGVVGQKMGEAALTLSGKAEYEDRPFDLNGFTGALPRLPIRNAVIEVVAIHGFQVIGSGKTGATLGDFSLTVNNSTRQAGVYLRVVSQTDPINNTKVDIKNNAVSKSLLSFISTGLDDSMSDSIIQDMVATASGIGGAFNLLDVLSKASEFVQSDGGCAVPGDCIPPLVTVYWEPGSADGTFYDSSVAAIHVLGGGTADGDSDEYDDTVVIHEYGHFILDKMSPAKDDSPGGAHFLDKNDQDIRLSWSEGWANFFAFAVRNSPIYLDTIQNNVGISFNIEDYSSSTSPMLATTAIYTTNEIAVAGVLWDAIDSPADSVDTLALTFGDILQTVLSFLVGNPTTMETFWLEFEKGTTTSGSVSEFQAILNERKIELKADAGDLGPETTLLDGVKQHHTIYRNGADPTMDTDTIPFAALSGMTYTVKTFNLMNGADTILTIKNGGTTVASNGNPNDNPNGVIFSASCNVNPTTGISNCPKNGPLNLSSSVTFTSPTTGTLTAEVTRSPTPPPSAGVFGSYDISLTQNP